MAEQIDVWKACQEGNLDQVKIALLQDKEAAGRANPLDQVPPLHWAALNGHTAVCGLLLDNGAPVNQLGGDHWSTALHWATCRGQIGTMALLIQRGADVTGLRDQQGYLPIHIAAQHGQTFALLFLLSSVRTGHVDVVDLHGRTALIWASYRGHDEAVAALIHEGASVSLKDRSGCTALHWASIKGVPRAVHHLVNAGADPHDIDGDGKSSIDHAREKRWPWYEAVLKESGHSIGKNTRFVDLETGLMTTAPAKNPPRWLPQRLFNPILDERALRLLLGRILPPITTTLCFYVAAYAMNLMVGIALVIALLGGCRGLYLILMPSASMHDNKVPILNSIHYTVNMLGIMISLTLLLPSMTSYRITIMAIPFFTMASSFMLYKTQTADAGRVGKPKSDEERHNLIHSLALEDRLGRRTYCLTCRAGKPIRSKHCPACGHCVARFDHHCPWTNNCIGAGNHRGFIVYLFASLLGSVFFCKATWNFYKAKVVIDVSGISSNFLYPIVCAFYWLRECYTQAPFLFVLTYIVGAGGFGIFLLAGFQLYFVARNRTTNENANHWRLEYLGTEVLDHGVYNNCVAFWSGKEVAASYMALSTQPDGLIEHSPSLPVPGRIQVGKPVVINVASKENNERESSQDSAPLNMIQPNIAHE